MKKILYAIGFLIFVQAHPVSAQHACATDESNRELMIQHGNNQEDMKRFDAQFKEYLKTYDLSQAKVQSGFGKKSVKTYIIPVVVQVLHQYGSENISDGQIQSEIDFLNKSYKRLNRDTTNTRPIFKDVAGVVNVDFRLARKDPNGNPTNGIVRYYSPLTDRGDDNLKKKSVWDSKRYFNMWVVQKIAKEVTGGIVAGYAQFPFFNPGTFGSASTDGIMVGYQFFGQSPYNVILDNAYYSVTSTHEAGHWMGLYHPFQGDSCDLENDGIQETPPRYYNSASVNQNFCVAVNKDSNSCSVDNPDLPDMYENYMDYFGGGCSNNMFTSQQVARMHFCLENYRPELVSAANLVSTGVDDSTYALPNPTLPIASFNMYPNAGLNTVRSCLSKAVAFQDNSYNSTVSAWAWDFGEGANPATSTSQNPSNIIYNTPGWKTVTLTVTGPNGTNTLTKKDYVYVENTSESLSGSVHTADWDYMNDFLDKGWYFENETSGAKWVRTTDVAYDGIASLKLNSVTLVNKFNYSIISPSYNLTSAPNPYITFNYAFAPNLTTLTINNAKATGDSQDGLSVYVSTDCGKSWLQRYKVSGNISNPALINPMSTLPTSGGTSGVPSSVTFTPGSKDQWKAVTVQGTSNITAQNNIRFKITFTAQGGNNFYIDNLMVGMSTGLNNLTAEKLQFAAYPNPFNATTTLEYFNEERVHADVKLFDLLGKEITTVFSGQQEMGRQKLAIDRNALHLTSGIYLVKMTFENNVVYTHKLVVN